MVDKYSRSWSEPARPLLRTLAGREPTGFLAAVYPSSRPSLLLEDNEKHGEDAEGSSTARGGNQDAPDPDTQANETDHRRGA